MEGELPMQQDNNSSKCSILLELAALDDLEGFEHAVKEGCDIDQAFAWYGRRPCSTKMGLMWRTPLMIATMYGSFRVLEYILKSGKVYFSPLLAKLVSSSDANENQPENSSAFPLNLCFNLLNKTLESWRIGVLQIGLIYIVYDQSRRQKQMKVPKRKGTAPTKPENLKHSDLKLPSISLERPQESLQIGVLKFGKYYVTYERNCEQTEDTQQRQQMETAESLEEEAAGASVEEHIWWSAFIDPNQSTNEERRENQLQGIATSAPETSESSYPTYHLFLPGSIWDINYEGGWQDKQINPVENIDSDTFESASASELSSIREPNVPSVDQGQQDEQDGEAGQPSSEEH